MMTLSTAVGCENYIVIYTYVVCFKKLIFTFMLCIKPFNRLLLVCSGRIYKNIQ